MKAVMSLGQLEGELERKKCVLRDVEMLKRERSPEYQYQ